MAFPGWLPWDALYLSISRKAVEYYKFFSAMLSILVDLMLLAFSTQRSRQPLPPFLPPGRSEKDEPLAIGGKLDAGRHLQVGPDARGVAGACRRGRPKGQLRTRRGARVRTNQHVAAIGAEGRCLPVALARQWP